MVIIVQLIHAGSEEDHIYVCSVQICEFVEYVNNKHSDVNIQFEREFNVIYVNYNISIVQWKIIIIILFYSCLDQYQDHHMMCLGYHATVRKIDSATSFLVRYIILLCV